MIVFLSDIYEFLNLSFRASLWIVFIHVVTIVGSNTEWIEAKILGVLGSGRRKGITGWE